MQTLFSAMVGHSRQNGGAIAVSDSFGAFSRGEFLARIVSLAAGLPRKSRVIAIFAPNGRDWAVAQLACALAGKIVVPVPTFFNAGQIGHILRDAAVDLILAAKETWSQAQYPGIGTHPIESCPQDGDMPLPAAGFGQIIYTSGSTGQPKGVRLESGQLLWSANSLASATLAKESDSYLSVLPLPLLLETICAVFIPALVGARVHFETRLAEDAGRGNVAGLAQAFAVHRPTMSVLVPQLLRVWAGELAATGTRAPDSLRFVAVGGAPVSDRVSSAAWNLGIPVFEGYGLSECSSVVSLNRADYRRPGTVGQPLDGLAVTIEEGEILVDGPSVTDGYLGQPPAGRPWRTSDLGEMDSDGFLTIHGRKDNLIVTAFGRNISPEWIETMLLGDPRIACCAVVGHGQSHLTALVVPSRHGADWFSKASHSQVQDFVAECCSAAPDYAVPRDCTVVSLEEAVSREFLTANGRVRRGQVSEYFRVQAQQSAS